jgi:Glycosyltransferase family 87
MKFLNSKLSHWPRWALWSFTSFGVLVTIGFTYCVVNPHVFAPWLYSSHYKVSFLDLLGRINNLKQLRQNGNIYHWRGPEAFTYPPGAIIFFWPVQFLSFRFWQYFSVLGSLWSLSLSLAVAVNRIQRAPWRTAMPLGLCGAVVLAMLYPPIMSDLIWGNISIVIFTATVLDWFVVPKRYRGILVGLAAAVKIYPVVFIAWWAWRRQWSEVRMAIFSGATFSSAATLIWWPSTHTFLTTQVFGGGEIHRFQQPSFNSSSILAFFTRPPFHPGDVPLVVVGVLSLLVLALSFRGAVRLLDHKHPFPAFLILSIGMRIVMPIAWDHYYIFIPFLIFVITEMGWRTPLSRASAAALILLLFPWVFLRVGHPVPHSALQATFNFLEQNIILGLLVTLLVASNLESPHRSAQGIKLNSHG